MSLFTFDLSGPAPAAAAPLPLTPPSTPRPLARFDHHLECASCPTEGAQNRTPVNDSQETSPEAPANAETAPVDSASSQDQPKADREEKETDEPSTDDATGAAAAAQQHSPAPRAVNRRNPATDRADSVNAEIKLPAIDTAHAAPTAAGVLQKATADSSLPADEHADGVAVLAASADNTQSPENENQEVEIDTAQVAQDQPQESPALAAAIGGEPATVTPTVVLSQTVAAKTATSEDALTAAHAVEKSDRKNARAAKTSGETLANTSAGQEPIAAATEARVNGLTPTGNDPNTAEPTDAKESPGEPASMDAPQKTDAREAAAPALLTSKHDKAPAAEGRADGLTEAERVRFVQRVARAFHAVGEEAGEVRLRLSPPELGSLRLELAIRDGALSARLETETAAARNVLLDNLPALRERLAEQNIKVEKFDVHVRDEHRQSGGQQFNGQADVPRQAHRQRHHAAAVQSQTVAQSVERSSVRQESAGELNIVI